MTVASFTVSPFAENTYVVHDRGRAALIDPGFYGASERRQALEYLAEHELTIDRLLLTHAHIDHVLDCAYWSDTLELEFGMHEEDLELLKHAQYQAQMFGIEIHDPPTPSRFLKEGDEIRLGGGRFVVLETPGHSPGSVCFYNEAQGFVIAGDVLFNGSIGRTDLWHGSLEVLMNSIRDKLLVLPDETVVYPGHGPATTIGHERAHNPFLQD